MIRPNGYAAAVLFMMEKHAGQVRKGSGTPYFAHPLAVSAMVVEHGGNMDQAVAALLHDVIEDCGVTSGQLEGLFGHNVARIVEACTDGAADANGVKPPWRERKEAYLADLPGHRSDAFLVIACDKVHNAESIVNDMIDKGPAVFARFAGKARGTAWYYSCIAQVLANVPGIPTRLMARLVDAASKIEDAADRIAAHELMQERATGSPL